MRWVLGFDLQQVLLLLPLRDYLTVLSQKWVRLSKEGHLASCDAR